MVALKAVPLAVADRRMAGRVVGGWKKKEQIPAEEKESSRLELLV